MTVGRTRPAEAGVSEAIPSAMVPSAMVPSMMVPSASTRVVQPEKKPDRPHEIRLLRRPHRSRPGATPPITCRELRVYRANKDRLQPGGSKKEPPGVEQKEAPLNRKKTNRAKRNDTSKMSWPNRTLSRGRGGSFLFRPVFRAWAAGQSVSA